MGSPLWASPSLLKASLHLTPEALEFPLTFKSHIPHSQKKSESCFVIAVSFDYDKKRLLATGWCTWTFLNVCGVLLMPMLRLLYLQLFLKQNLMHCHSYGLLFGKLATKFILVHSLNFFRFLVHRTPAAIIWQESLLGLLCTAHNWAQSNGCRSCCGYLKMLSFILTNLEILTFIFINYKLQVVNFFFSLTEKI